MEWKWMSGHRKREIGGKFDGGVLGADRGSRYLGILIRQRAESGWREWARGWCQVGNGGNRNSRISEEKKWISRVGMEGAQHAAARDWAVNTRISPPWCFQRGESGRNGSQSPENSNNQH